MPGVCAVLGSSSLPGMTLTPCSFQSTGSCLSLMARLRPVHRTRSAARHALSSIPVADRHYLDLLDAGGSAQLDDIALLRAAQRAGDRRDPAHLPFLEVGFVDTDDRHRLLLVPAIGVGDRRAEEDAAPVLLRRGVDHLARLEPL